MDCHKDCQGAHKILAPQSADFNDIRIFLIYRIHKRVRMDLLGKNIRTREQAYEKYCKSHTNYSPLFVKAIIASESSEFCRLKSAGWQL
jgi:hypothetical protein